MTDIKAIEQITLTPGYGVGDEIFAQLDRLGVSTNVHPFSGLTCDYHPLPVDEQTDVIVVKIYDDHASGLYDAQKVWNFLNTIEYASFDHIWDLLAPFEV